MTDNLVDFAEPITDQRRLVEFLAAGETEQQLIGVEHEKFVFCRDSLMPLPYGGHGGIRQILENLQRFGWRPETECGNLIGLSDEGAGISLEPGGQLEYASAPLQTLHQVAAALSKHLDQANGSATQLDAGLLGLGFYPKWHRDKVFWIPRSRYALMRTYMPSVGRLGLDMMSRSCSIQVNLDFASESDMVRKYRIALALQPIVSALFANSPFRANQPAGFLSYRGHVWTETDADRCGLPGFVFEPGMGYERYVEYVLDTPMYSVQQGGAHLDLTGQSFRDFLQGRLRGLPGERPTLADWKAHLNTLMPEVRLKQVLEMRGADSGSLAATLAVPALWAGLLYDATACDVTWDLVKNWQAPECAELWRRAPQLGLRTPFRNSSVRHYAREVLAIAREGLRRRACLDAAGHDETLFLDIAQGFVDSGQTAADMLLEAYYERGRDGVDFVFETCAY